MSNVHCPQPCDTRNTSQFRKMIVLIMRTIRREKSKLQAYSSRRKLSNKNTNNA